MAKECRYTFRSFPDPQLDHSLVNGPVRKVSRDCLINDYISLHFAENLDRLWRRTVDIPVGDAVFVADGDGEPPVVCPDELDRAVAGTRQLYVRSLALVRSLDHLPIGGGTWNTKI